jgi:hypothetical protein
MTGDKERRGTRKDGGQGKTGASPVSTFSTAQNVETGLAPVFRVPSFLYGFSRTVFHEGAGCGIRTRDLNFGKVACYHYTKPASSLNRDDYSQ